MPTGTVSTTITRSSLSSPRDTTSYTEQRDAVASFELMMEFELGWGARIVQLSTTRVETVTTILGSVLDSTLIEGDVETMKPFVEACRMHTALFTQLGEQYAGSLVGTTGRHWEKPSIPFAFKAQISQLCASGSTVRSLMSTMLLCDVEEHQTREAFNILRGQKFSELLSAVVLVKFHGSDPLEVLELFGIGEIA